MKTSQRHTASEAWDWHYQLYIGLQVSSTKRIWWWWWTLGWLHTVTHERNKRFTAVVFWFQFISKRLRNAEKSTWSIVILNAVKVLKLTLSDDKTFYWCIFHYCICANVCIYYILLFKMKRIYRGFCFDC